MRTQTRPRPHRQLGTCPASKKVRFRDHREAVQALHSAVRAREFSDGDTRRAECRAYACPACHGWHLTSRVA